MKRILLAGLCCACFSPGARADLIAAWDFFGVSNTTTTSATPATVSATVGTGSIDVSAFGLGTGQGTNPERTSFAGSTNNVFVGSVDLNPGTALALANSTANGKSLFFSFSMTGYQDLTLSFDTRGTATGFNSGSWAWSNDGINYTTLAGINTASRIGTFGTSNVNFSAESGLNNASTAFLRYTLDGATSSAGNNRIDNVQLSGTPISVPEPASVVFGGLGIALLSLVGFKRRH